MKTLLKIFFLLMASLNAASQNWSITGIPLYPTDIKCMYVDTINNSFYCSGLIFDSINPSNSLSICKYDGADWSTIGSFNGVVAAVITYNNELIVGGSFQNINQITVNNIARYDSTLNQWLSFGDFNASIRRLKVLNGELYAMGDFTMIDGVPIYGLAKWNGLQWTDVYGFPYFDIHIITDIALYNGEVYVAGNFYDQSLGIEDITYYHNGVWQKVGVGFFGSFNSIAKLENYNNELYAAGLILQSEGNIGNGIQKWNGVIWTEVGGSLQDQQNSNIQMISVRDMTTYNGELYVSGTFSFAGHIPAKQLAKWNGSQWCGFGTSSEFNLNTLTLAFFQDTLYINGGIDTINGNYTNYLIKWIGGNYIDSCSVPFTVIGNVFSPFTIYQTPGSNSLNIHCESFNGPCSIYLIDQYGRCVFKKELTNFNKVIELDIGNHSTGVYILNVIGKNITLKCKTLII